MAAYIQVTNRNLREIHKANEEHQGAFLMSEGKEFHDFSGTDIVKAKIGLFRNATLDPEHKHGPWLRAKFDAEHNREYRLHPGREKLPTDASEDAKNWERAGEFFENLRVGRYEFQIYSLGVLGAPVFGAGKLLFMSPWSENAFKEAMMCSLTEMVDAINASAKKAKRPSTGLGSREINTIVDYVMDDISTGRVVAHNIKAGENADAYLGM